MNVKTIHMTDLLKQCDDLYETVMIVAKRAKQIIDERFVPIDENEDVEDSIEFDQPIVTTYLDKPESIALEEFLNGELQWRNPIEDDQLIDES
jgi:DNA-directed RNA polymerase omega subunit